MRRPATSGMFAGRFGSCSDLLCFRSIDRRRFHGCSKPNEPSGLSRHAHMPFKERVYAITVRAVYQEEGMSVHNGLPYLRAKKIGGFGSSEHKYVVITRPLSAPIV